MEKEDKCIVDEIDLGKEKKRTSRISIDEKINNQRIKERMQNKSANHKKTKIHNMNLTLSIIMFLFTSIIALVVILNKGNFGEYSLVMGKNTMIHTAELECDSEFLSILDNETSGVKLTVDGVDITDDFTLNSSDEEVAKIENNKIVVGEKEGVATIVAYYEPYNMNITTSVVSYIPINEITATIPSKNVSVGGTEKLNLSIEPSNGTKKYITYKSSDENIAKVDKDGVITGISAGKVEITIVDELTGASNVKSITVK